MSWYCLPGGIIHYFSLIGYNLHILSYVRLVTANILLRFVISKDSNNVDKVRFDGGLGVVCTIHPIDQSVNQSSPS